MSETTLSAQIRAAVNRTGRARLQRNNTGLFSRPGTELRVQCGLGVGGADLVGVLRSGRAFCLEIKTAAGRPSPDQLRWHSAARRWNVFVRVVRSVDEALAAIDAAEQGALE
jgi:hypothetical protein